MNRASLIYPPGYSKEQLPRSDLQSVSMLSEKCFQSLEVDVTPDVFQTLPFTLLALDSARRTKDSKCFPVSVFIPANLTSIVTKTAISCVFFIALFYKKGLYVIFLLILFVKNLLPVFNFISNDKSTSQ
jgi:hypothetical protein